MIDDSARFCPMCGVPLFGRPARLARGSILRVGEDAEVRVEEPLGEGGMGVVHRGWLEPLSSGRLAGTSGHPVAVKVLRPELSARELARRMFLREAAALERLAHPNVVRFIALAEYGSQLAIVIEFVEGEPLSRHIQRGLANRSDPGLPCLPLDRAWRLFAQLLSALAAVHAIGILHRDVKPANVLVRPDGVVKLTDFGIARLPESGGNTGGIIPGTGAYMAPEQVRGDALDGRVDLYAAGIVLYEMLCGCTPFETPDRDELALRSAQIEEAPRPIRALVPSLPPAIDVVIARALAKDSRHRYPTALELGDALCTALGLDPGPLWPLAREFAEIARTLSAPLPRLDPSLLNRADHLRTAMMTPLKR
ncbi:MAG TPA: serine/threonine-protein kinase [Polyangiaceae bacterium]|nr:serine/threonine-protein kinase [Polyangiaceae bacterium]